MLNLQMLREIVERLLGSLEDTSMMVIAKITNAADDVHQLEDELKDALRLVVAALRAKVLDRTRQRRTRRRNLKPALNEAPDLGRVCKWSSREDDLLRVLTTDGTVNSAALLVLAALCLILHLLIRFDDEDQSEGTFEAEDVLTGGDGVDVLTRQGGCLQLTERTDGKFTRRAGLIFNRW